MSERALAFVEEWVGENIHADAAPPAAAPAGGDEARARAYANQCVAAAQAQDIPEYEIQEAIEDLTTFMAAAIIEANEREYGEAADDDAVDDGEDDAADDDGGKPGAG